MTRDFDIGALFEAIDAQRQARGLSWRQVAHEVNRGEMAGRPIAASTIMGMRARRHGIEGDSVLQMLLWLGRTPESFVPEGSAGAPLAQPPAGSTLRWDPRRLHSALDAARRARAMTWREVAGEIGVPPAMLSALDARSRVAFPQVMRITRWLGQPAATYTRAFPRGDKRRLLALS